MRQQPTSKAGIASHEVGLAWSSRIGVRPPSPYPAGVFKAFGQAAFKLLAGNFHGSQSTCSSSTKGAKTNILQASLVSIRKLWFFTIAPGWTQRKFPIRKQEIFRKFKEIKELCGVVPMYVAQAIPKIDAEIAEKGRFRMETNYLTFVSSSVMLALLRCARKLLN